MLDDRDEYISVKTVFRQDSRRVGIRMGNGSALSVLLREIRSMYSLPSSSNISLTYIDEEVSCSFVVCITIIQKDTLNIFREGDFLEAIRVMRPQTLKVLVDIVTLPECASAGPRGPGPAAPELRPQR